MLEDGVTISFASTVEPSNNGHILGPSILSFVERLSSFRGYSVLLLLVCPLLGGLSLSKCPFL